MFVLLVLLVSPSTAADRDCQTVLDNLPTSVKKTKVWKKCDAASEDLMQCQTDGFKVRSSGFLFFQHFNTSVFFFSLRNLF